jgi:hypothetical protein
MAVTEAHSRFWHGNEEFIGEMPLNIGSPRSSQLLRTTRSTNASGLTATAKHTFGHKKEASMTRISKGFVLIGALAALALSPNVASAGMHLASGGGAGKVQGFQINKQTDTASPKLYNFHNGTHIPNMTVYDKHKDW